MTTPRQNQAALEAWPTVLVLLGLAALFLGERVVGDGTARWVLDALAAFALVVSVAARVRARARADAAGRALLGAVLGAHVGLAAGAALYVLYAMPRSEGTVDKVLSGATLMAALACWTLGAACLVVIELVAAQMRASGFIEIHRVRAATGIALALVSAVFGLGALNYATEKLDVRKDLSFAAPTSPSGATLSLLDAAKCKPEVFLFFDRGSPALAELNDYFDGLEQRGVVVTAQDQALDPVLSKALKVTRNGTVALRCGERSETWSVGTDRDDAQRKLGKLDEEIRTRLAKLTRDASNIYVVYGHRERALEAASKDQPPGITLLKRLAESLNAKVKRLGIQEGLSKAVPEDAGVVVVPGPTTALLPEEAGALAAYAERGGALLVLADPRATHGLEPLLTRLGVVVGKDELVNDRDYVSQTRTDADHVFLFSASFGNHKATKSLTDLRGKAAVFFLSAGAIEKAPGTAADVKITALARSRPATWIDVVSNRAFDPTEKRNIYDMAVAVEVPHGEKPATRAVVIGDSDVLADFIVAGNEANQIFAYDTLQWLLRDDAATSGAITVTEDAPIRHSRDEDALWFYGTTFAAPLLVLIGGLVFVRSKRRRRAS